METYLQDQPRDIIEATQEIATGINVGETVVFCGAGISYNSGLPVVAQFIPFVLLALCGPRNEVRLIQEELEGIEDAVARYDRLLYTIRERMGIWDGAVQKIMTAFPFEAFVEALAEESAIEKILDIYDADSYEPAVEPSTTHHFLAKLVAAGKVTTIVTTNFDQLIEKALEREGKTAGRDYDLLYREEEFGKIDWAKDRTRLIKIHGSIHDKQAMAITLRQVAQKDLSEDRADIIRHVYAQGRHKSVLIVGYSCSDVFDLSPQIETLTENLKPVFLVQHSGGRGVEDIREQKDKNPFKGFENGKRVHLNTDRLVRALWDLTVDGPYAATKSTANWNKKIDEWYANSVREPAEAMRINVIGKLCLRIAEWPSAIRCYERLLTISREHNHEGAEGLALGNMGLAYGYLGEYRKAIELHQKALEISHRIGNARGEGNNLNGIGLAYMHLGEYQKGIDLYEKTLEIYQSIGGGCAG